MDVNIRQCAEIVISLKEEMNEGRSAIAYPPVSDMQIAEFIKRIGEDMERSNAALFEHLRLTSNTPENIRKAARGS
jgi:hypothetical protein